MDLTISQLEAIAGGFSSPARTANMISIVAGLSTYGTQAGLTSPARLAQYVAQVAHESGRFRYDREIWGPTRAQNRYDTRTDLGNSAARDGDGFLYRGRTGIEVTGKANYGQFRDWCHDHGLAAPDFVADPDAVLTDPWEGLAPIWYWSTRNLNRYADTGDIEMITRRINGGLNGLDDRVDLYVRSALVLLGQELSVGAIKRFQAAHSLVPDDIAGPKTRAALHKALRALPDSTGESAAVSAGGPSSAEPAPPEASTASCQAEIDAIIARLDAIEAQIGGL